MNKWSIGTFFSRVFLVLAVVCGLSAWTWADKPNILWIFAEDTSPWMGCYGHAANAGATPHIDSLAQQGVLFRRAYVPAPVCSACRSAIMGGMNQIRFNAHEHRSSRGPAKLYLPEGMKLLPQIMNEHGYSTFNLGKTDYNFVLSNDEIFSFHQPRREPIPWEKVKNSQPFFGQIQTAGGKQNTSNWPADRRTDRSAVTVPLDYPDNEIYREVVAEHYDSIRKDDDFIGTILDGLKANGLWENTIVVYFGDHGANHLVRHKQMPTEGGLRVPFVLAGPKQWVPSQMARDDLVDMLDLSATTLAWAGIPIPESWEGRDLFADDFEARQFVAAAKDRLDHTIDRVRTIRTERFRYTRNYKLDRIFLQPQYRDRQPYTRNLHELYRKGKLSARHAEIYFGERPAEELYDVEKDPAQMHNLAGKPAYAEELARHRKLLDDWLARGDWGAGEESIGELRFQAQDHKWGKAVNQEYERVRSDEDGDGLSGAWEKISGRDPMDGKLEFYFDNGGWQTEGWKGEGNLGNIAGYLGYLDFDLADGKGSLVRDGLEVDAARNAKNLKLNLRSSTTLMVSLSADNGSGRMARVAGPLKVKGREDFASYAFDLSSNPHWSGHIRKLRIDFQGEPGAFIEVDSIVAN